MDIEFDSQIPDYQKVSLVIESCVTLEQLKYAEHYVDLFKQQYDVDVKMNGFLDRCIFSKKMKLKNGWNNKN
tara:strand:+ start:86 stop:301 length:216 start_codon:yes stop_codon:yes gene_type:complete